MFDEDEDKCREKEIELGEGAEAVLLFGIEAVQVQYTKYSTSLGRSDRPGVLISSSLAHLPRRPSFPETPPFPLLSCTASVCARGAQSAPPRSQAFPFNHRLVRVAIPCSPPFLSIQAKR